MRPAARLSSDPHERIRTHCDARLQESDKLVAVTLQLSTRTVLALIVLAVAVPVGLFAAMLIDNAWRQRRGGRPAEHWIPPARCWSRSIRRGAEERHRLGVIPAAVDFAPRPPAPAPYRRLLLTDAPLPDRAISTGGAGGGRTPAGMAGAVPTGCEGRTPRGHAGSRERRGRPHRGLLRCSISPRPPR